jgi:SAM-dependent methyltransferase
VKTIEELTLHLPGQTCLFAEPEKRAESDQWWTPTALSRRIAAWVPPTSRVLEPACGSGNLISALLDRGHDPALITGIEKDAKWADFARERFDNRVNIICGDFLSINVEDELGLTARSFFDLALMNPPYADGMHARFVEHALAIGIPTVLGILPVTIEYGLERHAGLWSKAKVVRRALVPGRVSYGGAFSASFETVGLRIVARTEKRPDDEVLSVQEERWIL